MKRVSVFALLAALATLVLLSPARAAEGAATLNSGDTAWMIVSTALVMMMTRPVWLFSTAACRATRTCSTPWP